MFIIFNIIIIIVVIYYFSKIFLPSLCDTYTASLSYFASHSLEKKCHCFSSTVTLIAHSQAHAHNGLFYTIKWLFVKIKFQLNPPRKKK